MAPNRNIVRVTFKPEDLAAIERASDGNPRPWIVQTCTAAARRPPEAPPKVDNPSLAVALQQLSRLEILLTNNTSLKGINYQQAIIQVRKAAAHIRGIQEKEQEPTPANPADLYNLFPV